MCFILWLDTHSEKSVVLFEAWFKMMKIRM
jgi:hypothetical protein